MEQNNGEMKNDKHICPTGNCCDKCCNCSCHGASKGYYLKHFLILVLGVIFAFWCGYKLGTIKGYMMSVYPGMYMKHEWRDYKPQAPVVEDVTVEPIEQNQ